MTITDVVVVVLIIISSIIDFVSTLWPLLGACPGTAGTSCLTTRTPCQAWLDESFLLKQVNQYLPASQFYHPDMIQNYKSHGSPHINHELGPHYLSWHGSFLIFPILTCGLNLLVVDLGVSDEMMMMMMVPLSRQPFSCNHPTGCFARVISGLPRW